MNYEMAWLNYKKIKTTPTTESISCIVCKTEDLARPVVKSAADELSYAWQKLFDRELEVIDFEGDLERNDIQDLEKLNCKNSIFAKAESENLNSKKSNYKKPCGIILSPLSKPSLKPGGYCFKYNNGNIEISSGDDGGLLYGAFRLLAFIRMDTNLKDVDITSEPSMPLRMLNHWDNADGSIERGYSGNSFFFKGGEILVNERTKDYARLVASVGINAVVINNVNVGGEATYFITKKHFESLSRMSKIFNAYGIKLFLSLNYASPIELGALDTADPMDKNVINWWRDKIDEIYSYLPDFGGFLVKADSEGRPGPFTYGRTHADGANMLADAISPHDGLIIWRCFVYNCQQDWRDRKTDRARSGYDNFAKLDGEFRENVILQIKNGPMDFQVREPVHPLFGGMEHTNQMLEVQIAQEYTGQQRHVCYLLPMFREILDFKTHVRREKDAVKDIVSGHTFNQTNCGMAAVSNTGDDENWTGHDLAAANLYGFGRLSFDNELSAEGIAMEWISLTFGQDEKVMDVIFFILMQSWPAYEKYNAPLGVGWMVNPAFHYGPSVDGYEYDRWGTYHRADCLGIGVDRTSCGTGYASLYHEENARVYESLEDCPDELLLFFHHVPYTHVLHSGKTVIQHIYDTHFEGVEIVDEIIRWFETLQGLVDEKAFDRMRERFLHQKEHSREWRDQINSYFFRKSGIADEKGRKIY